MKFSKLLQNEKILSALNSLGYTDATEVQQKAMPIVLKGSDIVVRSQTGSGKTFAYVLPLLENLDYQNHSVQVLIVCPTRELALQVKNEIDKFTNTFKQLKVVPVYGGSDISRQINKLKQKPQIVVGTPGRLLDHIERRTIKLSGLKTVVLDEADEMLNMGFLADIENILKSTPSQKQTLMFSATFPKEILNITKKYLVNPEQIEVGKENVSLESIKQYYLNVSSQNKQEALVKIYETFKPSKSIVFTNTKIMAQNLSDYLNRIGYYSQSLHGDLRQSVRNKVLNEFKTCKVNILVASDVAARGIDINNIDFVINYDLPNNIEYFLHRMGRTARAGKSGNAITIVTNKTQLSILKEYEAQTNSRIVEFKTALSTANTKDYGKSKAGSKEKSRTNNKSNNKDYGLKDFKQSKSTFKTQEKPQSKNRKFKDFAIEKPTTKYGRGKDFAKNSKSKFEKFGKEFSKDVKPNKNKRQNKKDSKFSDFEIEFSKPKFRKPKGRVKKTRK